MSHKLIKLSLQQNPKFASFPNTNAQTHVYMHDILVFEYNSGLCSVFPLTHNRCEVVISWWSPLLPKISIYATKCESILEKSGIFIHLQSKYCINLSCKKNLTISWQCMKWPVAHSLNSTWFWLELVGNCRERLKITMECTNIQFCERLGHGWQFHTLSWVQIAARW